MISKLEKITKDGWKELGERADGEVEKLAELCGVKKRRLQEFFSETFGIPPKRWMEREWMERAIKPLTLGVKVVLVAREMGFKDVPHFNKVFRRCFNARPT